MYGLKLAEETQLLTGDGTGQNLSGLITNATAYNRGTVAGDTDLDVIRKAKTQVRDSFFEPDGVIINPHDWERIELVKTIYGEYVASVPKVGAPPQFWGMAVVSTPAVPVGNSCAALSAWRQRSGIGGTPPSRSVASMPISSPET